jgi:hypothetical protein
MQFEAKRPLREAAFAMRERGDDYNVKTEPLHIGKATAQRYVIRQRRELEAGE